MPVNNSSTGPNDASLYRLPESDEKESESLNRSRSEEEQPLLAKTQDVARESLSTSTKEETPRSPPNNTTILTSNSPDLSVSKTVRLGPTPPAELNRERENKRAADRDEDNLSFEDFISKTPKKSIKASKLLGADSGPVEKTASKATATSTIISTTTYPEKLNPQSLRNRAILGVKVFFAVVIPPIGFFWLLGKIVSISGGIFRLAGYIGRDEFLFEEQKGLKTGSGGAERIILPALSVYQKQLIEVQSEKTVENPTYTRLNTDRNMFFEANNKLANRISLETPDKKANLDGVILFPDEAAKQAYEANKSGKFIIRYGGNMACYENYLKSPEFQKYNAAGFTVIMVNPPGVMDSTGYPTNADDLVLAGCTPVSFLVNSGVEPKNITLVGESLGGSIATSAAAQYPGVRLANIRSFSSLANTVKGLAGGGVLGTIAKCFVAAILYFRNWEIDAHRAWDKVPLTNKWMITAENDEIIKGGGKLFHTTSRKIKKFQTKLEKGSLERLQLKASAREHFHAIKIAGGTHGSLLDDILDEHIQFITQTPAELDAHVKEIILSNKSLDEKYVALQSLPISSPLFRDNEFCNALKAIDSDKPHVANSKITEINIKLVLGRIFHNKTWDQKQIQDLMIWADIAKRGKYENALRIIQGADFLWTPTEKELTIGKNLQTSNVQAYRPHTAILTSLLHKQYLKVIFGKNTDIDEVRTTKIQSILKNLKSPTASGNFAIRHLKGKYEAALQDQKAALEEAYFNGLLDPKSSITYLNKFRLIEKFTKFDGAPIQNPKVLEKARAFIQEAQKSNKSEQKALGLALSLRLIRNEIALKTESGELTDVAKQEIISRLEILTDEFVKVSKNMPKDIGPIRFLAPLEEIVNQVDVASADMCENCVKMIVLSKSTSPTNELSEKLQAMKAIKPEELPPYLSAVYEIGVKKVTAGLNEILRSNGILASDKLKILETLPESMKKEYSEQILEIQKKAKKEEEEDEAAEAPKSGEIAVQTAEEPKDNATKLSAKLRKLQKKIK